MTPGWRHSRQGAGTYDGCRDVGSLTPLHQILPYGSQFRDTASSAGHTWANAEIRDDAQERRAVGQMVAAIQRWLDAALLVLSAYSGGSVTGQGRLVYYGAGGA